jgi:Flp pilus assembly protein TadG
MRANVAGVIPSALRRGAARRSLWRDRGGAAGIYVAVVSAAMVGMAGLALDLGRLWTINTQAQDAADAAALAAASQLDMSSTATTRAYNAATTTALVQNQQALSGTGGTVTIQTVDFLAALPNNDATPITAANILCSGTACTAAQSTQVNFVRVTTQSLPHQNFILSAFGAPNSSGTSATAVAGNTKVICQIPPLFICNPDEPTGNTDPMAPFNIDNWRGKEVLLKYQKTGGTWTPGNFSLLQVPITSSTTLPACTRNGNGQDPSCIEQALAAITPGTGCVRTTVNVRTGQVTSVVGPGLNTRFDMWQDTNTLPQSTANYGPSVDVTKGEVAMKNGQPDCGFSPSDTIVLAPPQGEAIPNDACLNSGNCNTVNPVRFGDGVWNCSTYWSASHPGKTPPAGCTSTASLAGTGLSRFGMYQYEINTPGDIQNNTAQGGENEHPICATNTVDATDGANRRIIYFGIVNCNAESAILNGNSGGGGGGGGTPVPVVAFAGGFLVQPVSNPGAGQGETIYMEFENVALPGNGVLHEIVQLYR